MLGNRQASSGLVGKSKNILFTISCAITCHTSTAMSIQCERVLVLLSILCLKKRSHLLPDNVGKLVFFMHFFIHIQCIYMCLLLQLILSWYLLKL